MLIQNGYYFIVGSSPATRPDMVVGKKQEVSIAFFRMLIPIGLQKSQGTAAVAAGTLRPRRGISHGMIRLANQRSGGPAAAQPRHR